MKRVFFITFILLMTSCGMDKEKNDKDQNPTLLTTKNLKEASTTLGNFTATAVRRTLNVDFVFLPTEIFNSKNAVVVKPEMTDAEIESVVKEFPKGPENVLLVGSMKGSSIKEFLINRSREFYKVDLETAGLWYHVGFTGGITTSTYFSIEGRFDIEDHKYYSIAILDDFYFGTAFPGYKYRNNFNFSFKRTKYEALINDCVRKYLKTATQFPPWFRERAKVTLTPPLESGFKKISEIQGDKHASPLINNKVTTRGVITVLGTPDWYPWGTEFYIESLEPDGRPETSEALRVHMFSYETLGKDLEQGDFIEISGTVFEDVRTNGMGETTLRFVDSIKVLEKNKFSSLPPSAKLSKKGRVIPTDFISTYGGRLMEKNFLNLSDGIDFWESLEGMRVEITDAVVLGFRGGREDYYEDNSNAYLSLYITPQEFITEKSASYVGGLMIDAPKYDFNPEIVSLITNYLTHTKNLDVKKYYSVGDTFEGSFEAILTYNRTIFGGGEYALVVPDEQKTLSKSDIKKSSKVALKDRPISKLKSDKLNEITVATYNLENLSAFQINRSLEDRMDYMADSIVTNLKCPDILNLVEVQDNNGISFRKDQDAEITIRKLRSLIQSSCLKMNYQIVEVEPFLHGEGGQPGGNIRVSILYNKNKLSIDYRNDGASGTPAVVLPEGRLSNNPGRIYPLNDAFIGSRRSLVVEFNVTARPGEKLYLIGNHLNSKLGDMDFWGNQQIARANSDDKRDKKTALINNFIHWLQSENQKANIVVLGDFNALSNEDSLNVLTDYEKTLQNMIFTLPKNKRYTTNHSGSSQPLDYVFVNSYITNTKKPQAEILHINSDYMAKLSDHDPVLIRVDF